MPAASTWTRKWSATANLITSRKPDDLPAFMQAIIQAVREAKPARAAAATVLSPKREVRSRVYSHGCRQASSKQPIRVKLYGLFPVTRRSYLAQLFVAVLLLVVLLILWMWLQNDRAGRQGVLSCRPGRKALFALSRLGDLGLCRPLAALCAIEAWIVLRRFSQKEALQRARPAEPQPETFNPEEGLTSHAIPLSTPRRKQDKFAFRHLVLAEPRGATPFGDQTRPRVAGPGVHPRAGPSANCYGFEFHDNDVLPFGASASQRDQILKDVKKAMGDWDIKAHHGHHQPLLSSRLQGWSLLQYRSGCTRPSQHKR